MKTCMNVFVHTIITVVGEEFAVMKEEKESETVGQGLEL